MMPRGLLNLTNKEMLIVILYCHKQLPFDLSAKIPTVTLDYIKIPKRFQ